MIEGFKRFELSMVLLCKMRGCEGFKGVEIRVRFVYFYFLCWVWCIKVIVF